MTDGRLIAPTCRAETNILRCDELTLRTNLLILHPQPPEDRKFHTSFLNDGMVFNGTSFAFIIS